MAAYEQNTQEYSSCSEQEAGYLSWSSVYNSEGIGPNVSRGIDLLVRVSRDREPASFFHVLYIVCLQEAWPRLQDGLPTWKIWIKGN